ATGRNAVGRGWVASRYRRMPRLNADSIQVPQSSNQIRVVDAAFVAAAHRDRLQVHVWSVNAEAEMTAVLEIGVDGIMTDRPSLLRDVLQARGRLLLG